MYTIGVDAHKRVHAAVAIDDGGREVASWRGANTPAGWRGVHAWATTLAAEHWWGIEGAGQYGRGLAQYLVAEGDGVVEVNPRLTATMRRGSRPRGKSDRLDALAVARVVQQEGNALPAVQVEDASAVLAVWVAEREAAQAEATRIRNQLHQQMVQLGAVDSRPWPDLTDADAVATLVDYVAPTADPVMVARASVVRHLAARLELALRQAVETAQAITAQARPHLGPLLALVGVAPLTAGMLAAYLGSGQRFATDAQLASYAGVAPLEASSGEHVRHRLNRTGHRPLNAILHRIAVVQGRCHPPAQAYLARKQAEGKTKAEALRCLKRYIARAVFRAWSQCTLPPLSEMEVPLT